MVLKTWMVIGVMVVSGCALVEDISTAHDRHEDEETIGGPIVAPGPETQPPSERPPAQEETVVVPDPVAPDPDHVTAPAPEPEPGLPCGANLLGIQGQPDDDQAIVLEVMMCRDIGCDPSANDPEVAKCMIDVAGADLVDDTVWLDAVALCTPHCSMATGPMPAPIGVHKKKRADLCPEDEDGAEEPEGC